MRASKEDDDKNWRRHAMVRSPAHKTHLCHENTENSRDNKFNSTESASMHTYAGEKSLGDATNDDDVSDVLCDVVSSQDDREALADFKQSRSLD